MRTDVLENLFLEEVQDIRSVEKQILEALTRIAKGVPAKRLWQGLKQLRESSEHHAVRLDRIVQEIGPASDDETVFCPSIAERVRGELQRTGSRAHGVLPSSYARLTSREVEVLQLIAEGYSNKQIAAEFQISIKTVEKHRQHLMAKLDLHDIAGLTRYAISAGVVDAIA